jgi:hypothetical protein
MSSIEDKQEKEPREDIHEEKSSIETLIKQKCFKQNKSSIKSTKDSIKQLHSKQDDTNPELSKDATTKIGSSELGKDEEEALEILNKRIQQEKDFIKYLNKDIDAYEEVIKEGEKSIRYKIKVINHKKNLIKQNKDTIKLLNRFITQDEVSINLLNSYIKNDRKLFKEEKVDVIRLIKNPAKIPELMTPANLKPIEQIFKKNSQDFIITKEIISSIAHLQLLNQNIPSN